MSKIIMGIDPGVKGAFCSMPIKDASLDNVVITEFKNLTDHEIIEAIKEIMPDVVYLESVFRVDKLVEHRGFLRGICKALHLSVHSVRPQEWKRLLKIPMNKSLTDAQKRKDELNFVHNTYPFLDIANRDNSASVCIAEYGRRKEMG
jgi:hypothetical protein